MIEHIWVGCDPTGYVAQELLVFSRCKFRNPMVLTWNFDFSKLLSQRKSVVRVPPEVGALKSIRVSNCCYAQRDKTYIEANSDMEA